MKRQSAQWVILGCAVVGWGGAATCNADVIWEQTDTRTDQGYIATIFTDFPSFTTFEFDDFSTSIAYTVSTATVPGIEVGKSSANIDCPGEIWTNLPDRGGTLVMMGHGTEDGQGVLHINFLGQILNPGTNYWFSAYVIRSFARGDKWYWTARDGVTGSEEMFYNPGGGFGFGSGSIPGSVVFGVPRDMVFRLEGEPVGPTLSVDGTCPGGGAITVSWDGATPGGRVGILYSRSEGTHTLPPGSPCAGTEIDLDRGGLRLVFSGSAGQDGSRRITGSAPEAACGHYLQLVDRATCATSNVARIE